MTAVTPVKYDETDHKHEPFGSGDQVPGSAIQIDPDSNNLLRSTGNGLMVELAAAPDVQTQYVSSSTGSDSNAGTKDAPLKTIRYAVSRLPAYTTGTIYLKAGDTFAIEDGATVDGTLNSIVGAGISVQNRTLNFDCYGDATYDALNAKTGVIASTYQGINRPTIQFTGRQPTDISNACVTAGFQGSGTVNMSALHLHATNSSGNQNYVYSGPFAMSSGGVSLTGCVVDCEELPYFYGPGTASTSCAITYCNFNATSGVPMLMQAHGYTLNAPYSDSAAGTDANGTTLDMNFNAVLGKSQSYPGIVILSAEARTYQGLITTNQITASSS